MTSKVTFRQVKLDDELRLNREWRAFVRGAQAMKGTSETPEPYRIAVLDRGKLVMILEIIDFRGAVTTLPVVGSAPDVAEARAHIHESDIFLFCVPGDDVGRWLRNPEPATALDDELGVLPIRSHFDRARAEREARGLQPPLLTIVITKRDRLTAITGRPAHEAYLQFVEHLDKLFPALFEAESPWRALVTAVRIAEFDDDGRIDPASVRPVNVLAAPLFWYHQHLAATIARRRTGVREKENASARAAQEIGRMSRNELTSWWFGEAIKGRTSERGRLQAEIGRLGRDIADDEAAMRRLAAELDLNVVVHRGKLFRLEDFA
ncbi:hypothetical protein [Dactylosporangium cerinum]